jgi:NADH-quinone oxidoreductase subunit H
MAEYINMITVSSVAVTLFFGGWTMGSLSGIPGLPFVWYALKVAVFLFVFIWLRATLPRIRYDQLMQLGWQVLLPLSVLNLLVTAAVIAFGWPWWVSGVIGAVVLVIGTVVLLQRRRAAQPATTKTTIAGVPLPDSVRLMHVEPTAAGGDLVEEPSKASATTMAVTS